MARFARPDIEYALASSCCQFYPPSLCSTQPDHPGWDAGAKMDTMNLKIAVSPDVIFQEVQLGESLLLDVKTLAYYALDPLGTRFWNALQVSRDADEALSLIATTSERPLSDLQLKFRAILSGLERSGLVTLEKTKA